MHTSKFKLCSALLIIMLTGSLCVNAQNKKDEPFTIENYYKVKWGYADEFIDLWKTNHYPLLKKALEKGDIISVTAEKPKLHSGEDTRWDFKVTITFKNAVLAFDPNPPIDQSARLRRTQLGHQIERKAFGINPTCVLPARSDQNVSPGVADSGDAVRLQISAVSNADLVLDHRYPVERFALLLICQLEVTKALIWQIECTMNAP